MHTTNQLDPERLLELMDRYQRGTASQAEIDTIHQWYDAFSHEPTYFDGIPESVRGQVRQRLWKQIMEAVSATSDPSPSHRLRRFRAWSMTAAAGLLLALGTWFFYMRPDYPAGPSDPIALIVPGSSKATLSLGDGRVIELNNGQDGIIVGDSLRYQDGTLLNGITGRHGTYRLQTPYGGQYQVILSDGTKVWLNAASSLTYPASFETGQDRFVILQGEAYFEVHPDPARPFRVQTSTQVVEVLGTHFLVNSYDNEPGMRTTLIEGLVRVRRHVPDRPVHEKNQEVLLKPGQESLLTEQGFTVKDVDVQASLDWIRGEFVFQDESIEQIMRRVARWYEVDIQYVGGVPPNETFKGRVSRFEDVHILLEMLEETGDIRFELQGRKILVYPSKQLSIKEGGAFQK